MMKKKAISVTALLLIVMLSLSTIKVEAANWEKDSTGWWWKEDNGSYPVNTWKYISGNWYWFSGNGYMATGWIKDGGTWYYLNGSGAMQTGWIKDGGTWYYLNGSGAMQTGWIKDGSSWYYLNGSGAMQTGWVKVNGSWYYLNGSGAMQTGWIKDGGTWYYLNSNGAMAHDCWIGNYYLGSNGGMYVDAYTPDGYYVNESGVWTPVWHNGGYEDVWVVDQEAYTEKVDFYISSLHALCTSCGYDMHQGFADKYGDAEFVKCAEGTLDLCYYDEQKKGYVDTGKKITLTADEDVREKLRSFMSEHLMHCPAGPNGVSVGYHSDDHMSYHYVKTETVTYPEEGHWERHWTSGYWK